MKHKHTLVPFLFTALAGACASSRGDLSRPISPNDTNARTEHPSDDVVAERPTPPYDDPSYSPERPSFPPDGPAYTTDGAQYSVQSPYQVEITGGDRRLPTYAQGGRTYVLG